MVACTTGDSLTQLYPIQQNVYAFCYTLSDIRIHFFCRVTLSYQVQNCATFQVLISGTSFEAAESNEGNELCRMWGRWLSGQMSLSGIFSVRMPRVEWPVDRSIQKTLVCTTRSISEIYKNQVSLHTVAESNGLTWWHQVQAIRLSSKEEDPASSLLAWNGRYLKRSGIWRLVSWATLSSWGDCAFLAVKLSGQVTSKVDKLQTAEMDSNELTIPAGIWCSYPMA